MVVLPLFYYIYYIFFYFPRLWQTLCLELVPEICPLLIKDVTHHEETVRVAAAEALSSAMSQYQEESASVLSQLTEIYQQKLYVSLSLSHPCLNIVQSGVSFQGNNIFYFDGLCDHGSICAYV